MLGTTPRSRRALALIDGNSPRPAGLHSAVGKLSEVSGRTASIGPQESPRRVLVDGCNGPEMEGRQPPAHVPTEEIPRFLDAPVDPHVEDRSAVPEAEAHGGESSRKDVLRLLEEQLASGGSVRDLYRSLYLSQLSRERPNAASLSPVSDQSFLQNLSLCNGSGSAPGSCTPIAAFQPAELPESREPEPVTTAAINPGVALEHEARDEALMWAVETSREHPHEGFPHDARELRAGGKELQSFLAMPSVQDRRPAKPPGEGFQLMAPEKHMSEAMQEMMLLQEANATANATINALTFHITQLEVEEKEVVALLQRKCTLLQDKLDTMRTASADVARTTSDALDLAEVPVESPPPPPSQPVHVQKRPLPSPPGTFHRDFNELEEGVCNWSTDCIIMDLASPAPDRTSVNQSNSGRRVHAVFARDVVSPFCKMSRGNLHRLGEAGGREVVHAFEGLAWHRGTPILDSFDSCAGWLSAAPLFPAASAGKTELA